MNGREAAKFFAVICALYPRDNAFANAPKETIAMWSVMLKDIPFDLAQVALQAHSSRSQFPPSISEIRAAALEIAKPEISMTGDEAWKIARETMRKYGCSNLPVISTGADGSIVRRYARDEAKKNTPPEVWKIMERMGYRDMCMTENIDVIRGQFLRMWDAYSRRRKEQALLPPSVRSITESLTKRMVIEAGKEQVNDECREDHGTTVPQIRE